MPEMRASPVAGSGWKTAPRANEPVERTGVELVQEAAVEEGVEADGTGVLVRHGPADVVVPADVRRPRRPAGEGSSRSSDAVASDARRSARALQRTTMSWLL